MSKALGFRAFEAFEKFGENKFKSFIILIFTSMFQYYS